jgi:Asp-tRNA(Asn)/Glu-tRNA(Gln) amidotransferase C subunit
MRLTVKRFLSVTLVMAVGFLIGAKQDTPPVTDADIRAAARLTGLDWSDTERDSMRTDLDELLESYEKLRTVSIRNEVPPAIQFNPLPIGATLRAKRRGKVDVPRPVVERPDDLNDSPSLRSPSLPNFCARAA